MKALFPIGLSTQRLKHEQALATYGRMATADGRLGQETAAAVNRQNKRDGAPSGLSSEGYKSFFTPFLPAVTAAAIARGLPLRKLRSTPAPFGTPAQ